MPDERSVDVVRAEFEASCRALAGNITPLITRPRVARTGNVVTWDGRLLARVPGYDRRERRRLARFFVAQAEAMASAERDRLSAHHDAIAAEWERVRPPEPGIACTVWINETRYDAHVADVTRASQAEILAALQAAGAPVSDEGQVQRARCETALRLFTDTLEVYGDITLGIPERPDARAHDLPGLLAFLGGEDDDA